MDNEVHVTFDIKRPENLIQSDLNTLIIKLDNIRVEINTGIRDHKIWNCHIDSMIETLKTMKIKEIEHEI